MTYTCIRGFTAQGVNFTMGDTINRTQYIALTAEERGNFIPTEYDDILKRVRNGDDIFKRSELGTLGEMHRAGMIEADFYLDGTVRVKEILNQASSR